MYVCMYVCMLTYTYVCICMLAYTYGLSRARHSGGRAANRLFYCLRPPPIIANVKIKSTPMMGNMPRAWNSVSKKTIYLMHESGGQVPNSRSIIAKSL